jgi:hypothetical protein
MKYTIFLIIPALLFAASCRKSKLTAFDKNVNADITVEFDNIVGAEDLHLNTGTYKNTAGETFTVTKLKYYVSNFIFTNSDGNSFTVPQDSCYFLVDESDISTYKPRIRLPEGEYRTLTFTIGVDSLRNTMDISKRTGVLDPLQICIGAGIVVISSLSWKELRQLYPARNLFSTITWVALEGTPPLHLIT